MVAYKKVTFVLLVCLCSAAYGRGAADLAGLQFFARPVPDDTGAETSGLSRPTADVQPEHSTTDARAAGRAGGIEAAPEAIPAPLLAAIGRRLDAISDEIAANGPRSPALAEEYVQLADLYQEADAHLLALDVLQRGLNVIRINQGLYSLQQVSVVGRIIASRLALGQHGEAARLDRDVLDLVLRNSEDPQVPAILRGLAERQMATFRRLLAEPPPPQLTVNVNPVPSFAMRMPSVEPALTALRSARRHYLRALDAAAREAEQPVADLFELEERILQTLHLEIEHPELHGDRRRSPRETPIFALGEMLFETHVLNVARFGTPEAVADALMRLADWRLLFSNNGRALETYRRAHELLMEQSLDEQAIDEMLAPEVPRALPVSERTSSADREARPYRGYIDVSFLIGRYGTSRRVEIIDSSPGTPRAVERRLKRQIYQTRFRPRFVDGEVARGDEAALRYYYDY